ncbi:MAG: EAL domain-containing protein [Acidimicrobiales bacterium]
MTGATRDAVAAGEEPEEESPGDALITESGVGVVGYLADLALVLDEAPGWAEAAAAAVAAVAGGAGWSAGYLNRPSTGAERPTVAGWWSSDPERFRVLRQVTLASAGSGQSDLVVAARGGRPQPAPERGEAANLAGVRWTLAVACRPWPRPGPPPVLVFMAGAEPANLVAEMGGPWIQVAEVAAGLLVGRLLDIDLEPSAPTPGVGPQEPRPEEPRPQEHRPQEHRPEEHRPQEPRPEEHRLGDLPTAKLPAQGSSAAERGPEARRPEPRRTSRPRAAEAELAVLAAPEEVEREEEELRLAIDSGQLRVVYQPIVDVVNGATRGFEALVRWAHPERGLLPPPAFIPLAEATGLIVPLGARVLETACRQLRAWDAEAATAGLRMSVNVSAHQLTGEAWAAEVATTIAEAGLAPQRLTLEVTETAVMADVAAAARRLAALRSGGVRVAIDDFGTGHSSLNYLRQLPVDVLKVDKSFIDGLALGPHDSALARAIIKLAATLGLDAVAEGVSDRRQLGMLRRLRCPYAQGYLFSPPLTSAEAQIFLRSQSP